MRRENITLMNRHFIKKISLYIITAALLTTNLCSCDNNRNKSISKSDFYFDTIITITLYGTTDEEILDSCFKIAKDCENKFSNTIQKSEVSKINKNAGKSPVTVSKETVELIQKGIDYGILSEGSFDITIGKLSELWNISDLSKNCTTSDNQVEASVIPTSKNIENTLKSIDYSKIEIINDTVFLKDENAKIDLGGIAKGYVADLMKDYLNENNVSSGIINLGGNILTVGSKPSKDPYTIGIQKPFSDTGENIATLQINDKSVVTSGIYQRYVKVGDKIYHHLLNVETGYPYENDLLSVTIISDKSVDGDALSTICYGLGLEAGVKYIECLEDDVDAIFIADDYQVYYTKGAAKKYNLTECN